MRISICLKLTLTLLILTIIVLVSSMTLVGLIFDPENKNNRRNIPDITLQKSAQLLSGIYQEQGGWSSLSAQHFQALLEKASSLVVFEEKHGNSGALPPSFLPPPRPVFSLTSTSLQDHTGQLILGVSLYPSENNVISKDIIVDNQKVGAILARPLYRPPQDKQDSPFSFLPILAMSLCIALIMSALFARMIIKPIRQSLRNIRKLSNGDYSINNPTERDDELGDLINNVNYLALTLRENQDSRSRLLTDISHELRTPLTILTGEINMLKDGISEFNNESLLSIDQEVSRLNTLVSSLYQLSLSDVGGLRYELMSIDLSDTIKQFIASLRPRCEARHIELQTQIEDNIRIRADTQKLDQLLTHLSENALNYTSTPGTIRIRLKKRQHSAFLEISDSPPGIDIENYNKLFEPLYRSEESRSRRTGGSGLGLAICRNIVQAHHGSIHASPSDLGGLSLQILLPIDLP